MVLFKLFDNLENWDRFIQNPIANLLSPSGLTFYGGLICAAATILWYAKRKNIGLLHLCDAAAPGLMLSYATGRIGCQVSGDGHHFEAVIVSQAFEGLNRVRRHQVVYSALGDRMREEIHALSMKTVTPAEWQTR